MLTRKTALLTISASIMFAMASICQAESSPAPATETDTATATDAQTMTIADIFASKDTITGKVVQVKGKVVKVSRNIMKLNWIHIKDGTGEVGSDKLIFRSTTKPPAVGADVIAQGKVATDLDFGYGYKYSILVDDARFTQ